MDKVEERSLDQLAMADLLVKPIDGLTVGQRLNAFIRGDLLIWSNAYLVTFNTEIPGHWLEVRDASALFVRNAKYAIRGENRWRVPTDEDAEKRPKCRVKTESGYWQTCTLIYVEPKATEHRFFVVDKDNDWFWVACCEIQDGGDDVPPPPQ